MRSAITITGTISRSSTPLNLSQDGVREVVSLTEGGVTWRRTTVSGKYQPGRALLQAVRDTATDVLVLRVYGTTGTQLANRVTEVVTAFAQFSYTVTLVIDGVTRIIDCEPADIQVVGDDTRRKGLRFALMRELQISIPRDPQLTQGDI